MAQSAILRTDNPAQFYEDFLVPTMFLPFADKLVDRVRPQPGERILDLACGTGIVARRVAAQLGAGNGIVGLDLSPMMIEVAKEAAAGESFGEIEWHAGNAGELPFDDASFDLVLCQQALQVFPDQVGALAEMRRVLVPGGRVATNTWTAIEEHPLDLLIAQSIERHLGVPAFRGPFALGDQRLLKSLFEDAGFEQIGIEVVSCTLEFASTDAYVELIVIGGVAALPAFQGLDEAASAKLIDGIRADVAGALEELTVDGRLVIPSERSAITIARKAD